METVSLYQLQRAQQQKECFKTIAKKRGQGLRHSNRLKTKLVWLVGLLIAADAIFLLCLFY